MRPLSRPPHGFGLYIFHVGPSTNKKISQVYVMCENMLEISFPDGSGGLPMMCKKGLNHLSTVFMGVDHGVDNGIG